MPLSFKAHVLPNPLVFWWRAVSYCISGNHALEFLCWKLCNRWWESQLDLVIRKVHFKKTQVQYNYMWLSGEWFLMNARLFLTETLLPSSLSSFLLCTFVKQIHKAPVYVNLHCILSFYWLCMQSLKFCSLAFLLNVKRFMWRCVFIFIFSIIFAPEIDILFCSDCG